MLYVLGFSLLPELIWTFLVTSENEQNIQTNNGTYQPHYLLLLTYEKSVQIFYLKLGCNIGINVSIQPSFAPKQGKLPRFIHFLAEGDELTKVFCFLLVWSKTFFVTNVPLSLLVLPLLSSPPCPSIPSPCPCLPQVFPLSFLYAPFSQIYRDTFQFVVKALAYLADILAISFCNNLVTYFVKSSLLLNFWTRGLLYVF